MDKITKALYDACKFALSRSQHNYDACYNCKMQSELDCGSCEKDVAQALQDAIDLADKGETNEQKTD